MLIRPALVPALISIPWRSERCSFAAPTWTDIGCSCAARQRAFGRAEEGRAGDPPLPCLRSGRFNRTRPVHPHDVVPVSCRIYHARLCGVGSSTCCLSPPTFRKRRLAGRFKTQRAVARPPRTPQRPCIGVMKLPPRNRGRIVRQAQTRAPRAIGADAVHRAATRTNMTCRKCIAGLSALAR